MIRDIAAVLSLSFKRGLRRSLADFTAIRGLRRQESVDDAFYKALRHDLGAAELDATRHYVLFGSAEGLDPAPSFSSIDYLARYPDVRQSGVNPFWHYQVFGAQEGRLASPSHQSGRPIDPYNIRPDDAVLEEIQRGAEFLQRFQLDTETPHLTAAIAALQARNAETSSRSSKPAVSIIIPVFGQLPYTLNCIDSLYGQKSKYSFEIIISDDCSIDETSFYLQRINGLVYRRNEKNLGFIGNCNAAAEIARGDLLVMLNNDTRVVPGWLDALVEAVRDLPAAGLVGSKLFNSDGSLQEAGGIVWRDASAWNYGRGDDPNRPAYCYAREVDYSSGASIAVPRKLWVKLGGFDLHFQPAYAEDSDFAFRVRAAGRKVWYQPTSRVIHYEGRTSGTDTSTGIKANQITNQVKLEQRWRKALDGHRPNGVEPWFERERQVQKRVLVIDETTPTPDQDAGSVTCRQIMRVFMKMGYKVTFAPIDNFLFDPVYTPPLQSSGIECLYAPYVMSLKDHLREVGAHYDLIHVFRYTALARSVDLLRVLAPNAPIILNNMDLHYLRRTRQAEVSGDTDLLNAALEEKTREFTAMEKADVVCVPSTVELDILNKEAFPRPRILVPFMVDQEGPTRSAEKRTDIVFLGGFRHPPNEDAALWCVEEIWPAIAAATPEARLILAGSSPTPRLLALDLDRVLVPGKLDDLDPLFSKARVFVAPLRFGAGVKGKIFTAMAHGVPVVTTPIGIEGAQLAAGVDVLVAADSAEFARTVLQLYSDEALWAGLSAHGRRWIRDNASLKTGISAIRAAIQMAGLNN